jgi:hypothetical protein
MTLAPMTLMLPKLRILAAVALLCLCAECLPERPAPEGTCVREPSSVDCSVTGYNDEIVSAGLVGYSCTGSARPDDTPTFIDGVPQGLLCADRGPVGGDSGKQGYCCTDTITSCAYDPTGDCDEATSGYQCWGSNRPESLNAALTCSNGFMEQGLYNYCCTGQPEPSVCEQVDSIGCDIRMLGFLCEGDRLPRGEDLGPNKSRADYFRPVCSMARPANNPEYNQYCCYMPAPVPVGGTCVWDPLVPDCAPGRFGFACYGPDTAEDDYLPMQCDPGFRGESAEGYPATLYCCDLEG